MPENELKVKLRNYVRQNMDEGFSTTQTIQRENPPLLRMAIPTSGHQGYNLSQQPTIRDTSLMTYMAVPTSGHQGYNPRQQQTFPTAIPLTMMAVHTSGHHGYQSAGAYPSDIPGFDTRNAGASIDECFQTQPIIDNRLQCKK